MGHDPPTHQVWIKVVGLPLQAWTIPEVMSVLRTFGHPIQILPFGRDAGHFRDITALVETEDPARIPLAYTYREGDFSTQIDILILSWRNWEDSYFPPPNTPPIQDPSPSHSSHHGNQLTPHRHTSSSSSSNGQPSEPTIDLSSWSPRSHPHLFFHPALPVQTQTPTTFSFTLSIDAHHQQFTLSIASHRHNTFEKFDRAAATENPSVISDVAQILPLQDPFPYSSSRPIPLHRLSPLINSPAQTETWGDTQALIGGLSNLLTFLALSPRRPPRQTEIVSYIPTLEEAQPLKLLAHDLSPPHPAQAQSLLKSKKRTAQQCYSLPHIKSYSFLTPTPGPSLLPALPNLSVPILLPPGLQEMAISQEAGNGLMSNQDLSQKDLQQMVAEDQLQTDVFKMDEIPTLSHTAAPLPASKMLKKNKLPTRRSQRIQARATQPIHTPSKRTKRQRATIDFLPDSHLTPLDTSKALSILQATGLVINQNIEEMLDEAVKKDQDAHMADMSMPQTPLHDNTPPLLSQGQISLCSCNARR